MLIKLKRHTFRQACRWRYGSGYKVAEATSRKCHTVTLNNGYEFAGHEEIAKKLEMDVYFSHPYHSWERGLNENTNELLRKYVTKGTLFETVKEIEV